MLPRPRIIRSSVFNSPAYGEIHRATSLALGEQGLLQMTSSARNDDNRPTVEYGDVKYVRCGFSLFRLLGGRGNVASPTGGWATGRRTTAARAYKCDAMCHVVTRGSLRGVPPPPATRYTIVGRSDRLFYPFHPLTQW